MGTRLNISDENGNCLFYGSKLFGYAELSTCKSLEYLWRVCNAELSQKFASFRVFAVYFDYIECTERMCKMTVPQLMEFVKLYDEDIENHDIGYKVDKVADNLIIPNGVEFVWLSCE